MAGNSEGLLASFLKALVKKQTVRNKGPPPGPPHKPPLLIKGEACASQPSPLLKCSNL